MSGQILLVGATFFSVLDAARLRAAAHGFIHSGFQRKPGRSEERNAAYYAGRFSLGTLLQRVSPGGKIGRNDAWGYLELYDAHAKRLSNFFGNISHTHGVSVAVLATSTVGIDVEKMDRSVERALKRAASETEIKNALRWGENHSDLSANVALWSAKEAAAKALGLGINFGLQDFVVELLGDSPYEVRTHRKGPLTVSDLAVGFKSFEGYLVSISGARGILTSGITVEKLSF